MKTVTNGKSPSEACSGFPITACVSKICPEAQFLILTKNSASELHREIRPTREKKIQNRNIDAAFETVFRISK
jgi:hypothetical protein